jgi:hypothetical protein
MTSSLAIPQLAKKAKTEAMKLFFVLGTGRSGTSWLASILNSHEEIVYSHEPLSRLRIPYVKSYVERIKSGHRLSSEERERLLHEWCRAHHDCRRPPYFPKKYLHAPVWMQHAGWIFTRMTGVGENLFCSAFSPDPRASSLKLLVKDIAWSKHLETIVYALQPKLVVIARHPCGVVSSLIKGQRLGLMPTHERATWLKDYGEYCQAYGYSLRAVHAMEPWEFLALQWLVDNSIYQGITRVYPDSLMIIYEDLCREPIGISESIFGFLGMQMGSQTRDFIERSTKETSSSFADILQGKNPYFGVVKDPYKASQSWRTKLTSQQIDQVMAIAGQLPQFDEYWPEESAKAEGTEETYRGPARIIAEKQVKPGHRPRYRAMPIARPDLSVPLCLEVSQGSDHAQPHTVGVPFPQGALRNPDYLRLLDQFDHIVPLQTTILNRWPDGCVKWALLDFEVSSIAQGSCSWRLLACEEITPTTYRRGLQVQESPEAITIRTGPAMFEIRARQAPFLRAIVRDEEVLSPAETRVVFTTKHGGQFAVPLSQMALEDWGPVRATVRLDGAAAGCRFCLRLSFFAGSALIRVGLTIHNPQRASHPGGLWDLGDPGSVFFRGLELEMRLTEGAPHQISWKLDTSSGAESVVDDDLEIYQDSSGGENWRSNNHVNRHGVVPCAFRGYRLRVGGKERHGLRASPTLVLRTGNTGLAVAVPEFWQQFPKALKVDSGLLRIGLFPTQAADLHELQGGEQKTHVVWLDLEPGESTNSLDWVHSPIRSHAHASWYCQTSVIPAFDQAATASEYRLKSYLSHAIGGNRSLFARKEEVDEFGWRHYGDLYADHELAYYRGPLRLISHYNNQYDAIFGALLQFARTGDARWFELADPLARHVIDIDIYHTDQDVWAYNHGLFWHTDHYTNAATCTHRSFSRASIPFKTASYGGGPSNEHNYTTGLLHYYYMTGNRDARDAVIGLADWVIDRDNGEKTVFGIVDDGPTGLASCTLSLKYHGPGRGCGNSINALVDACLLTGHRRYLEEVELLIRRSIHPADDIASRGLLDAESHWSYTVFLIALVRYLFFKAEAGELDFMYAYARASLLVYAGWMVENEVPYLDHPERLEFPTETWAAQEIRKANVLRLAAGHADEPLRSRMIARGNELSERAWNDLHKFESRYVTRALVLMMTEGVRDTFLSDIGFPQQPRPAKDYSFGQPETFVPQKLRVFQKARTFRGLLEFLGRMFSVRVLNRVLRLRR